MFVFSFKKMEYYSSSFPIFTLLSSFKVIFLSIAMMNFSLSIIPSFFLSIIEKILFKYSKTSYLFSLFSFFNYFSSWLSASFVYPSILFWNPDVGFRDLFVISMDLMY